MQTVGCLDQGKFMNSKSSDLKALGKNFMIGWIVKTVFAVMVGTAAGTAVAQLFFCSHTIAGELFGSILLGTIVGAFVGVAQSTQLREVVRDPKLWIIASIAGWAIAIFLFEVNWPISRCLASSNAPSYIPGHLVEIVHRPVFIIAEQMERMIEGKTIHGSIYNAVTVIFMAALVGVMLGAPQGIWQWLVLRRDLPRSSTIVWGNVFMWAAAYLLILFVIDLVNFNQILTLMLIPIVLIEPAAATAFMLVRLQTKKIRARHG